MFLGATVTKVLCACLLYTSVAYVRFAGIHPPSVNTQRIVVVLHLLPEELACIGIVLSLIHIFMWSIGNEVLEQWTDAKADTLSLEEANLLSLIHI